MKTQYIKYTKIRSKDHTIFTYVIKFIKNTITPHEVCLKLNQLFILPENPTPVELLVKFPKF